jgi:hypothetical protein
MIVLSFLAMYILMYAMVNSFANVYNNVNQFYMAGLMAAPMAVIGLALMSSMYQDKRLNAIIAAASVPRLTDDSLVAANQSGCGDEARRHLHLRGPGEPSPA